MCGCEAHHTKARLCTCECSPRDHADPIDVLKQRQDVMQGREPEPGRGPLYPPGYVPPTDEEQGLSGWASALGLSFHSDDDSILVRHFYDHHRSMPDGRYTNDEVVLSYTSFSWALSVEYENQQIDPRRQVWWRGLTLRLGPFSLTASREKGKLHAR